MKIYININEESRNVPYPWKKNVYEQVEETVAEMSPFNENSDEVPLFPSFCQDDVHSHFVTVSNHRRYLDRLYYKLFFVYEPEDFIEDEVLDEESWKEYKENNDTDYASYEEYRKACEENLKEEYSYGLKAYNQMCARVGMDKNQEVKAPQGYVYIGTCRAHKYPTDLSGLVLEETAEGAFPADSMFDAQEHC